MKIKEQLQKYSDATYFRALIQLIPYVGGPIDTILSEKGAKWKSERLEYLIQDLARKYDKIINEQPKLEEIIKISIDSEEFYDILITAFREVTLNRSKEKIELFSNILLNYSSNPKGTIDDAEIIINVLSSLGTQDIIALKEIDKADNMKIYFINQKWVIWSNFKDYLCNNKITYNDGMKIPEYCIVSDDHLFLNSRLENHLLINKYESRDSSEYLYYGWSSSMQSFSASIPTIKYIEFKMSAFGKKFIFWITNN